MRGHRSPPSRVLALLVVLLTALALIGMVQAVNLLRHPLPDDMPPVPEQEGPEADPRTEIVCEEPQPIEGTERRDEQGVPGPQVLAHVTSNELLDCPSTYHARPVRYRGEVVGAVLHREGGAWVFLNDDIYGLTHGPLPAHRDYRGGNAGVGVFIPAALAGAVEIVGGPRYRGDVLEVTGEFRRTDPEHREAAVIVATEGEVVASGRPIEDPVLPERRGIAIGLALLAVAAVVGERMIARRL